MSGLCGYLLHEMVYSHQGVTNTHITSKHQSHTLHACSKNSLPALCFLVFLACKLHLCLLAVILVCYLVYLDLVSYECMS